MIRFHETRFVYCVQQGLVLKVAAPGSTATHNNTVTPPLATTRPHLLCAAVRRQLEQVHAGGGGGQPVCRALVQHAASHLVREEGGCGRRELVQVNTRQRTASLSAAFRRGTKGCRIPRLLVCMPTCMPNGGSRYLKPSSGGRGQDVMKRRKAACTGVGTHAPEPHPPVPQSGPPAG